MREGGSEQAIVVEKSVHECAFANYKLQSIQNSIDNGIVSFETQTIEGVPA